MNLNMFPLLDTRDNQAFALELITLVAMASDKKRDTPTKELFAQAGYDIHIFDDEVTKRQANGILNAISGFGALFEEMGIPSAKQEMQKSLQDTIQRIEEQDLAHGLPRTMQEAREQVSRYSSNRDFIQPFSAYISEKAFNLLVKHDNAFSVSGIKRVDNTNFDRQTGGFLYRALEPQGGDYRIENYNMQSSSVYRKDIDVTILLSAPDPTTNKDIYGKIRYEFIDVHYKPALSNYLHFESLKRQEDGETRLKNLKVRLAQLQQLLADEACLYDYQDDLLAQDHADSQNALKYAIYADKPSDSSVEENRGQILINSAILVMMFHLQIINQLNDFMKKIIIMEMMRVACVDDLASETALIMMKNVSELFRLPENFVDNLLLAFSNNNRDEVIKLIES